MLSSVGYLLTIGLLLVQQQLIAADCNVCAVSSSQTCVSNTQYKLCNKGNPVGDSYSCGPEQKCSLEGVCKPADSVTTPTCIGCNTCSENLVFACTGPKKFALCLGTQNKSPVVGTCEDDSVCNIYNPQICVQIDEGGTATCSAAEVSTTTATPTSTTPSPIKEPQAYCEIVNAEGRYPIGVDPETSCRQYIHCLDNDGSWIGAVYWCPANTYFDDAKMMCSKVKPARCSSQVRSLAISDLELL